MGKRENEFIAMMVREQMVNRCYDGRDGVRPSKYEDAMDLFWDSCMDSGIMRFNKIVFPDIRWYFAWRGWPIIYGDSIMTHHLYNDEYTLDNCYRTEYAGGEGPYFVEEVIAKRGDVVIDAGAYIGDFSAAAAVLGAKVYAFEPSTTPAAILKHVAALNNFKVVEEGLGDEVSSSKQFAITSSILTDGFNMEGVPQHEIREKIQVKMNTVDNFAEQTGEHIGFIKSDIEGYERYMLKGAEYVLKNHEPKLAIRLYHNMGEDRIVIPELIKKINPRYKIVMGAHRMTAYATTERGV